MRQMPRYVIRNTDNKCDDFELIVILEKGGVIVRAGEMSGGVCPRIMSRGECLSLAGQTTCNIDESDTPGQCTSSDKSSLFHLRSYG